MSGTLAKTGCPVQPDTPGTDGKNLKPESRGEPEEDHAVVHDAAADATAVFVQALRDAEGMYRAEDGPAVVVPWRYKGDHEAADGWEGSQVERYRWRRERRCCH
jgi:hypothetical protein